MAILIFQYLLLLASGPAIIPLACAQNLQKICGFVDYFLAAPSFHKSMLTTQKRCFNLCLFHPDCKSINYNLTNHQCALNNISHLDSSVGFKIVPRTFYAFNDSLADCDLTQRPDTEAKTSPTGTNGMWIEQEFSVVGKPSTQSSSYYEWSVAERANDGDTNVLMETSPYCSHTKQELHPWWRVDLGGEHWLGIITLVNRGDCCGNRLLGATVRAGLSPEFLNNKMCGSLVSSDQAQDGAWIDFVCDPWVLARYVSVNLNIWYSQVLQVCEVMVKEYVKVKPCKGQ